MILPIKTLDDLLKLTDKKLEITTIEDTGYYYTTLKEVCYDDKYVYFGVTHSGTCKWMSNNDNSKITERFFDYRDNTYALYNFIERLGVKVAEFGNSANVYTYTEDSEVFTCVDCGHKHITGQYIITQNGKGVICENCYYNMTHDCYGHYDYDYYTYDDDDDDDVL